ncbi:MAG: hydroxymethylpyrimidine/phosphomethylpyrimidine kinase, partial [Sandaracinaceae bacterium]
AAGVGRTVAARARAFSFPLVVDPVMVSKHGHALLDAEAADVVRRELLPTARLVTPNVPEAAALAGRPVTDRASARDAARAIADLGPAAVLLKGGHLGHGRAVDLLLADGEIVEVDGPRIETRHTHGTGCTLSSAIVARMAQGEELEAAVRGAKAYLTDALRTAPGIGRGTGPVDHFAEVPAHLSLRTTVPIRS